MIEIVKKGNLPGDKVIRATCYNCKTEFTFQAREATTVSDQRDGDCYEIECPLPGCNKSVYVTARY